MALTLWDLNDLLQRRRDPVWAGEMPYDVARGLELRNHSVYLSRQSLVHILEDHPDVTLYTLLHIPLAIKRAMLIRERKNPNIIVMSYQDPESYRRYVGALKIANQACEVWVSSFYRSRKRQTKALLKRGVMIKAHD